MRMQEDPTDLNGIPSQKREKKLAGWAAAPERDYATNLQIEIRCLGRGQPVATT